MWKLRSDSSFRGTVDFLAAIGLDEDAWLRLRTSIPSHYRQVLIPKRRAGHRILLVPDSLLMEAQRAFLRSFTPLLVVPRHITGGVPGGSIRRHAEPHTNKTWVATFDIEDFFGSIARDHVDRVLVELGLPPSVVAEILNLVFVGGTLPQGAPTSPLFANLALSDADRRLRRLTRRRGLALTRYLDDVALSSHEDFRELRGPVRQAFARDGFRLRPDKEKFMNSGTRQVVTGLVVNTAPRPTPEFYRRLQADLETLAVVDSMTLRRTVRGRLAHLAQFDRDAADELSAGIQTSAPWTSLA